MTSKSVGDPQTSEAPKSHPSMKSFFQAAHTEPSALANLLSCIELTSGDHEVTCHMGRTAYGV